MGVCTVPLLQIDIAIPILLLFFNLALPRLVGLLRVGPVGLLPRVVQRTLARIFFVRFFFHAPPTSSFGVRSRH
jgi:hypothetical protein